MTCNEVHWKFVCRHEELHRAGSASGNAGEFAMHAGEDHVHGGSHPCTFARAWTLVAAANGAGGSEVPDGAMEAHEKLPCKGVW